MGNMVMNKTKVILSWSFYSIQEDNKYTNKFNIVAKEWWMEKMLLHLMPSKHYIELTFEFKLKCWQAFSHVGGSKKDDSHKRKMPNTDYSYRYHCVEELSIIKCFQVL